MAILIHLLLLVDKADSKKGEMQFVISMACKSLFLMEVLRLAAGVYSEKSCYPLFSFHRLFRNLIYWLFIYSNEASVSKRCQMWRHPLCPIWKHLQSQLPRPVPLQHWLFLAHCSGGGLLCPPHLPPFWAGVPCSLCLRLYQDIQRRIRGWGEPPWDILWRHLPPAVHLLLECHVHHLPFRPPRRPQGLQCWLQKR